jgi:hypothetical protein
LTFSCGLEVDQINVKIFEIVELQCAPNLTKSYLSVDFGS